MKFCKCTIFFIIIVKVPIIIYFPRDLTFLCKSISSYRNKKANKLSGHNKECVKRRALLSVKANPNCKDCAEEAVEAAFERCYKDTFPFDRHPNLA